MFATKLNSVSLSLVAVAALLISARPSTAQPPPGGIKMWPWNVQGASQVAPRAAQPQQEVRNPLPQRSALISGPLNVVVTIPANAASSEYVTLRGPDGKVRKVPLEGGREAIAVREFTVHPGEKLTLTLMPSSQPAKSGER
jgi:hypothetical protein